MKINKAYNVIKYSKVTDKQIIKTYNIFVK